jgi:regulator of RNase E activity RraA
VPVSIDGQVVRPGDIVVGDEDGIVAFAPEQAEALITAARKTAELEEGIRAEIANGRVEQAWLDRVLKPFGL